MKRVLMTTLAAIATFAIAPAVQAAEFFPGDPQFNVTGDINSGPVTAFIGNTPVKGNFTDTFKFIINQTGVGSGGVITTADTFKGSTDLDLYEVFVNGVAATGLKSANGIFESFSISGLPISFGVDNLITVIGFSRGTGSYGGTVSFTPSAVPESATWAMMIIGFGAVGSAMRYRRRQTKVAFA